MANLIEEKFISVFSGSSDVIHNSEFRGCLEETIETISRMEASGSTIRWQCILHIREWDDGDVSVITINDLKPTVKYANVYADDNIRLSWLDDIVTAIHRKDMMDGLDWLGIIKSSIFYDGASECTFISPKDVMEMVDGKETP